MPHENLDSTIDATVTVEIVETNQYIWGLAGRVCTVMDAWQILCVDDGYIDADSWKMLCILTIGAMQSSINILGQS